MHPLISRVNSEAPILLRDHTTFGLGGPVEYFARVTSKSELLAVISEAQTLQVPIRILGGGSNILAADTGVSGLVVQIAILGIAHEFRGSDTVLTCGAGELFDDVIAYSVDRGWWGLENLSSIPGTVGATPIQNVGAYGVEFADVCESITAVHLETGEVRIFSHEACEFSYRDSFFKSEEGRLWAVVEVTLCVTSTPTPKVEYKDLAVYFSKIPPDNPMAVRAVVEEVRSRKFPDWHVLGTAGSFFKNPIISAEHYTHLQIIYPDLPGFLQTDGQYKVPLGWILDNIIHRRGKYDGLVGNYEGQALVVVAKRGATSAAVVFLARRIEAEVYDLTGISIEWEVTYWDA